MDLIAIVGAFTGLLAVFAAILWLDRSPMDEAIKQAQQWDSSQKKMARALERK